MTHKVTIYPYKPGEPHRASCTCGWKDEAVGYYPLLTLAGNHAADNRGELSK